jgi:hypothetical protein
MVRQLRFFALIGQLLGFCSTALVLTSCEGSSVNISLPGPNKIDLNKNGTEGTNTNVSHAVYVSSVVGDDGNPGTLNLPVATIKKGIALANSSGFSEVRVQQGIYYVNPWEQGLVLMSGISVIGGFNSDFSAQSKSNTTKILGTGVVNYQPPLVTGLNVRNLIFKGFTLRINGNSSSGISLERIDGVTISDNVFEMSSNWLEFCSPYST